jgi:hypothetical protein
MISIPKFKSFKVLYASFFTAAVMVIVSFSFKLIFSPAVRLANATAKHYLMGLLISLHNKM